jgi:hypothetical protein
MSKYADLKPVAGCHISNTGGIVVFEATEEFVVAGFSIVDSPFSEVRKHKVHYDRDGNPYFNKRGYKVFLSECIRFN